MSLEAWGDEGPDPIPEGYVSEEYYDEMKGTLREAVDLLIIALSAVEYGSGLHASIKKWLADNTVDGKVP